MDQNISAENLENEQMGMPSGEAQNDELIEIEDNQKKEEDNIEINLDQDSEINLEKIEKEINNELDENLNQNIENENKEIDQIEENLEFKNKDDLLIQEKEFENNEKEIEINKEFKNMEKNELIEIDQEKQVEKAENSEQQIKYREELENLQNEINTIIKGNKISQEKIIAENNKAQKEEKDEEEFKLDVDQNSNHQYQLNGEEEQIDEEEEQIDNEENSQNAQEEQEANEPEPPISWVKSSILKLDEFKEYLSSSTFINFKEAITDSSLKKKCKNYIMGIKESPVKSVEILTDIHTRPQPNSGYLGNLANSNFKDNQFNNKIIERYLNKVPQNDSKLPSNPDLYLKGKYQLISDNDRIKEIYANNYMKVPNSLNPYPYSRK